MSLELVKNNYVKYILIVNIFAFIISSFSEITTFNIFYFTYTAFITLTTLIIYKLRMSGRLDLFIFFIIFSFLYLSLGELTLEENKHYFYNVDDKKYFRLFNIICLNCILFYIYKKKYIFARSIEIKKINYLAISIIISLGYLCFFYMSFDTLNNDILNIFDKKSKYILKTQDFNIPYFIFFYFSIVIITFDFFFTKKIEFLKSLLLLIFVLPYILYLLFIGERSYIIMIFVPITYILFIRFSKYIKLNLLSALTIFMCFIIFSNIGVLRNYSDNLFRDINNLQDKSYSIIDIPTEFSSSIMSQRLIFNNTYYPSMGETYYSSIVRWIPNKVYNFKTNLSLSKETQVINYLNTRSMKEATSQNVSGVGYSFTSAAYKNFYFLGSILGTFLILLTINHINNFILLKNYYLSMIFLTLSGFSILILRSSYNGLFTIFFYTTFVCAIYFMLSNFFEKYKYFFIKKG